MKFFIVSLTIIAVVFIMLTLIGTQTHNKDQYSTKTAGVAKPDSVCFQLSAEAEKEIVRLGESVKVKVKLTNITDRRCLLTSINPLPYKIIVKDDSGKLRPKTEYLEKLEKYGPSSIFGQRAAPKEVFESNEIVNNLYDMSVPGTYSITFKRNVEAEPSGKRDEISSNTVKVKIVPAN